MLLLINLIASHQASQLLGAVRAVDVLSVDDEALVGHGEGAFLAVKAVFMPGFVLVVHHIGPSAKSCNGILTSRALLGHIALITVHTVELILMGCEASSSQRLLARVTHKALGVPGLVLIGESTAGNGLFAANAVLGKLLLVAGSAVHVITLGQEALGADRLLALKAGEALFMPDFMLVLHILTSWSDDFVAALAARRSVTISTLPTHDFAIVLGLKGLVGQRLVALGAAEAALVPVAILMVQFLCISADGFAAFSTSVCAELVEAAHAHRLVIFLDVLLALQVVSAVEAVKALSHGGAQITAGTTEQCESQLSAVVMRDGLLLVCRITGL